jgi:hypothetical protein
MMFARAHFKTATGTLASAEFSGVVFSDGSQSRFWIRLVIRAGIGQCAGQIRLFGVEYRYGENCEF